MAEPQVNVADTRVGDVDALREAARLMGQVSTQAKAAAARENGKRGGRPKGIPMSAETRRKIGEARRARASQKASSLPTGTSPLPTP
jgi:DNA invertase Pin-like site-specific DNA recombinase